jgi:hypothetical protein
MQKVIFSLFLLIIVVPASADKQQDQFDQKNVYDAFGELKLEPSTGVTLEEDVTSRIKRYMANLLYPVDMTSFVRPEKDPKLRELIVLLQRQMGEATTGVLTFRQFSKLQDAARGIDEVQVTVAPGKLVSRLDNSNVVSALERFHVWRNRRDSLVARFVILNSGLNRREGSGWANPTHRICVSV